MSTAAVFITASSWKRPKVHRQLDRLMDFAISTQWHSSQQYKETHHTRGCRGYLKVCVLNEGIRKTRVHMDLFHEHSILKQCQLLYHIRKKHSRFPETRRRGRRDKGT